MAGDHLDLDSMTVLSISSGHCSKLAQKAIHVKKHKETLNRDIGHLEVILASLLSRRDKKVLTVKK